ncbi:biotin transporter BioY [Lachnospiraceae bacterium ZAX-1]
MKKITTKDIVLIGLIAAILCILAPISIPIPISPVSITLGLFAVVMAGILLGKWQGLLCVAVYILIGMVGMPVFSNYSGGIQKIAGPSGGYLIGYLALVWIVGFFVEKFPSKIYMYFVGAVIGTVLCYAIGTLWMKVLLNLTFVEALMMGVIPFIPLDMVKIILAVLSCYPVRKTLKKQNLLQA